MIIQYDPEWIATTPCPKRASVRLPPRSVEDRFLPQPGGTARPLFTSARRDRKTSGYYGAGSRCRSISSLAPHAPHNKENLAVTLMQLCCRKIKRTHAVRVILFYPSMDTKG
ncbi:hypothetical protein, partial [Aneurinibacillus aneurinilyticus]|uniref:hypothetical protein n=1 Tax=Aneurinibacillus aneurinilyticus TaxID=1391 RepID=UPI001AE01C47